MLQERALRSAPWDACVTTVEQERAKAYTLGPLGDVGDACGAMWSKNALGMKANSNHALKGQQNSNYEDNH